MEFDILNEIITNTVGGLFRRMPSPQLGLREASTLINKPQSHPQPQQQPDKATTLIRHEKKKSSGDFSGSNMFSKEDNSVFSIDSAPSVQKSMDFAHVKSRSIDNMSDRKSIGSIASLNTSCGSIQPIKNEKESNVKMTSSVGNVHSSLTSQSLRQVAQPKNEPPILAKWLKKEGPVKLYEALDNLNLDIKSIDRVNLSALTLEQLSNEKKNVKNELKKYDAEFANVFKRNPEREEKEPMRPLYIYYKKIKQYLTKNAAKGRSSKGNSISSSQGNLGSAFEKDNRNIKGTSKNYLQEKENKQYGQKLDSSFEAQMKDRNTYNQEDDRREVYERGHKQAKGQPNTGFGPQDQIRRQLEEYRAFRLQLREKLHSYQTEFTKNNSRKIKYHKDIAPVENEYKHYKEIKQEIIRLEGLLNSYA